MENIAIIPARGGSKRIPRKNIIEFEGKPMIAWTIEAAVASGLFSKVLVSTDCEEIAEISREFGAEVPFLRDGNSDDFTDISEATCGALVQAEGYWNTTFDTVTQLMANCPLRRSGEIQEFHREFRSRKIDCMLSCFKFGWMNPWWAFRMDKQNKHSFLFDDAIKRRSQDLDDLFCPTGSIWIAKAESLKKTRSFHINSQQFYEIDWVSAVDIDDENDLRFAISLAQLSHKL